MRRSVSVLFSSLFLPLTVSAAETPASLVTHTLAHETANRMVVAALAECTRRGYTVAAAVVGRNGNLLAFLRNPLAGAHTEKVSQRKAWSAATFQTSTHELRSRTDLVHAPRVLLIRGGLPISIGGTFYGGIAVAGAAPEIDETCARSGIDSIKEDVLFGGD